MKKHTSFEKGKTITINIFYIRMNQCLLLDFNTHVYYSNKNLKWGSRNVYFTFCNQLQFYIYSHQSSIPLHTYLRQTFSLACWLNIQNTSKSLKTEEIKYKKNLPFFTIKISLEMQRKKRDKELKRNYETTTEKWTLWCFWTKSKVIFSYNTY